MWLYTNSAGAVATFSVDVSDVRDQAEAVSRGGLVGPPFDLVTPNFGRRATGNADEVVVMFPTACSIDLFTTAGGDGIGDAFLDEDLQGSVDGRERGRFTAQPFVKALGGDESVDASKRRGDDAALSRVSLCRSGVSRDRARP